MYTLSLEIINKCNLNCTYCYLGEKKDTYMSTETAQKAVEIAVHEAQKQYDKTLVVYFIGGEPLMAFDTMRNIVAYVKKRCTEIGLKNIFSTTINGTLLTEEITDFFIENQFEVKLSLDGPEEVHNLNRKDYKGNGSFQKIIHNLDYLKRYEKETGKKVSYAQVITKNNFKDFSRSYQFLLDLECERIETGMDYYGIWGEVELEELKEQLREVFFLYKRRIQEKKKWFYWNMFENYLEAYLLPCGFYACKMGLNSVFVTTDGNIYTCVELPEFKIGHVDSGLDVPRIREIVYAKDQENEKCRDCSYKMNCKTRGCQAANFEVHQDIYHPVDVNCMVTKTMYELIAKNISEKELSNMREELIRRRGYGKS